MLSQILKVKGVKAIPKKQQSLIHGGESFCTVTTNYSSYSVFFYDEFYADNYCRVNYPDEYCTVECDPMNYL